MEGSTVIQEVDGGVVAAQGFEANGVYCGIKQAEDALDLGVIFSRTPAAAAGVFTRNRVTGAPVKVSREHIANGKAQAVVVNSGNANACTGERGLADARAMAEAAAEALGLATEEVLVSSTGIIGHPLPMENIRSGVSSAVGSLGSGPEQAMNMARAIMTTDTRPKSIAVRTEIEGVAVTIGGISKGAGMIAPNMATMLCFITTDAAIESALLRDCLRSAADLSFNRITIDGHMSTSDTVVVLANGAAGNPAIESEGPALGTFQGALEHVMTALGKAIVRDGEGATKFVEVNVVGASTQDDAVRVAKEIAESPLVKTAINGGDPNWGRIVSAAGYAGVPLDEGRLQLHIGGILIFKDGVPVETDVQQVNAVMGAEEIVIELDLAMGEAEATMWTCDLSHDYVTINADYHT